MIPEMLMFPVTAPQADEAVVDGLREFGLV